MSVVQFSNQGFRFGSAEGLSHSQIEILQECFRTHDQGYTEELAGRGQPHITEIEGLGRVVIKTYYRGGILRHINQWTYIQVGKPRSQREFEYLQYVRSLGINAPEPLAYATKGYPLYHAWLVTREIPHTCSLSELSRENPQKAAAIMPQIVAQVQRLIAKGIYHGDFHPGNVLIDSHQQAYIIDFAKPRRTRASKQRLAKRYLKRWQRAILKYNLPQAIDTPLQAGLNTW